MKLELLYFEGCPSHERFAPRLRELIAGAQVDAEIVERRVESFEEAESERFLGSPTVRIDGRDVDPGAAERTDYGLKCRLYRYDGGQSGEPPDAWVREALQGARR